MAVKGSPAVSGKAAAAAEIPLAVLTPISNTARVFSKIARFLFASACSLSIFCFCWSNIALMAAFAASLSPANSVSRSKFSCSLARRSSLSISARSFSEARIDKAVSLATRPRSESVCLSISSRRISSALLASAISRRVFAIWASIAVVS